MRSVTYSMGVSLDGYIVGPDGGFDWTPPDDEVFRSWIDENPTGRRHNENRPDAPNGRGRDPEQSIPPRGRGAPNARARRTW